MRKSSVVALVSASLVASIAPVSAMAQHSHGSHSGDMPHHSGQSEERAPRAPPEPLPARTIEIQLTERGFEPDRVVAKLGERIKLVVTRATDATCAREVILDEFLIWDRLPLGTPVAETFRTGRPGDFTFHCANGAVRGTFTVEAEGPAKTP